MARPSKIAPKLHDEIKKKSAEGLDAGKIRQWLEKDHGVKVGLTAIQTFLRTVKEERKDVAKQVFAAAVAETAVQDIEILGSKVVLLNKKFDEAIDKGNTLDAKIYGDLLFKFLSTKLKLSGAEEQEDEQIKQKIKESLFSKLGK
jgi:hypothetical protein